MRADGTRFQLPVGASLGVDTSTGAAFAAQNQNHVHARQQKWRIGVQRELVKNLSVEVAYDGSFSDRNEISIRQDYLPKQFWIPGSLNARDAATQAALVANVPNPYTIANFTALQTTNPVLYQRMAGQAFFTSTTAVLHHVTGAFPASFMTVGNADPLVRQSWALANALGEQGVELDVLFYDDDHRPPLGHEYQFDLDLA